MSRTVGAPFDGASAAASAPPPPPTAIYVAPVVVASPGLVVTRTDANRAGGCLWGLLTAAIAWAAGGSVWWYTLTVAGDGTTTELWVWLSYACLRSISLGPPAATAYSCGPASFSDSAWINAVYPLSGGQPLWSN